MDRRQERLEILLEHDASLEAAAELLEYNRPVCDQAQLLPTLRFPLAPEPHVERWQVYASEAETSGVFEALKRRLVQLNFPIREGISQSKDYRAATRRGVSLDSLPESGSLHLKNPGRLSLTLHESLGGIIPVITTGCRHDFVALVQAFTQRNEPEPVPDSMGSCIITGYNNWDRINHLRHLWEAEQLTSASDATWAEEFRLRIRPCKELYQDRFIILSDGPYSNIPAEDMGLPDDEWQRHSMIIRTEHEATHYLTYRVLSAMRNNVLDELLADYRGIVAATGRYRADWFLRFMGLQDYPAYHTGYRLENYCKSLSPEAFTILHTLVKNAAENLEQYDHTHAAELSTKTAQSRLLLALACLSLEELASSHAQTHIQHALQRLPPFQEIEP